MGNNSQDYDFFIQLRSSPTSGVASRGLGCHTATQLSATARVSSVNKLAGTKRTEPSRLATISLATSVVAPVSIASAQLGYQ